MALRVLLADESVTIKKVIQLALQDFAVEVKAVPVGLDVLEVSKSFQPDLVFADILLQKRSGYEVCSDLKKDPATAAIPVVLMWSSFMELDQRQVDACGADGKLEKPFEVEALRKLVLELVPRTRSQRLAHFLEYPPSLAAPLRQEVRQQETKRQEAQHNEDHRSTPPPSAEPQMMAGGGVEMPVKPKMPPPLSSNKTSSGINPKPKAPATNPFGSSMENTGSYSVKTSTGLTPGIPERPAAPTAIPLGALPDLQLEGMEPPRTNPGKSSGWNMESFEPMDLSPLSVDDDLKNALSDEDDDTKESFQPLQLPQQPPHMEQPVRTSPSLHDDEDEDADADQWANRSLDKYRLPPLKPDESLAIDELTPDFAASHEAGRDSGHDVSPPTDSITHRLPEIAKAAPAKSSTKEVPEFSLSDDEYDGTAKLELDRTSSQTQTQKARPAIVRELLRDPDFTVGGGAVDLSSAGRPSSQLSASDEHLEEMVRKQVSPQLERLVERAVERAVEKAVAQLLPSIAEKIIKRELERLLDES